MRINIATTWRVIMLVGLPGIALLYRYTLSRPQWGEMTRVIVGQVLGRLRRLVVLMMMMIGVRGLGLLQPGGHLVIHILWF